MERFAPDERAGAWAVTAHGSVLAVGRPDRAGRRDVLYRPLDPRAGWRGSAPLFDALTVGRPAVVAGLVTSPLVMLARDATGRIVAEPSSDPWRHASWTPEPRSGDVRRVFRGYEALRSLARRTGGTEGLDCELVALALQLQDLLAPVQGAHLLEDVRAFTTAHGTVYELARVGPRLDLVRRPLCGPARQFMGVHAAGQRVVMGAPIVLFSADNRIASCTAAIEQVLVG